MAGNRDDDLARTVTAQASASAPAEAVEPVGPTLGRYRLERELGAGGMGVVHAAFDPDLERRIALKVLRSGGGGDAEKRLLREARAMARLVHPNVVTVHEVGSANGRDYVAMELVEGETLADWLRAERRTEAAVIDAFVAAGRGLAAAHAAGIVHRDFKPHNVLRGRGGRIVVTDFGLARDAQQTTDPLAVTRPLHAGTAVAEGTPSTPLAGLTMTGSVLGTPAYMAPEQWSGGAVTQATDQFAFCVALWEALAGERPFRGPTVDSLRDAVQLGPAALDASKIPRRLRRALRRGLDPLPSRRWPSMEALLAAMTRAERRPAVAVAIGSGAVVAAAVVYAIARSSSGDAPADACAAPVLDPAAVWSDAVRGKLEAAQRPGEARAIAADVERWQAARRRACAAVPALRPQQLACLDGVLVRLDVVARAVEQLAPSVPPADPGAFLIDPAVCEAARPPRLAVVASPEAREVAATALREFATPGPFAAEAAAALAERVAAEPCAAAAARMLAADTVRTPTVREQLIAEAEQDAERCGDDRLRAEIAVLSARFALGGIFLGSAISSKAKLAEVAVERVAQPDLTAELDVLRMMIASRAGNVDEAIARGEAAMAGYAARRRVAAQLAVGLRTLELRDIRSRPDDVATVPKLCDEWRAVALAQLGAGHPIVRRIDAHIAARSFQLGDVEGAHHKLEALRQAVPNDRPRRITGRVVDERGRPVAGATVVAGRSLAGSSIGVAMALPETAGDMRVTTTDAAGAFAIPDGPDDGVVVAQLADRRSMPVRAADIVTLALAATSRLEGRVDLRGEPPTRVLVSVEDPAMPLNMPYDLLAPVKPDGSFAVDGVPRKRVRVYAALRGPAARSWASVDVDASAPVVRGVKVAVASSKREVHVVVRSTVGTPVGNAQVFAFPGKRASGTLAELAKELTAANVLLGRQIEGEHAPRAVVGLARPGDLFATMPDVPEGVASACAIGLPGDLSDRDLQKKVNENLSKIEIRCVPILPGSEAVIVEVPPWPRFD